MHIPAKLKKKYHMENHVPPSPWVFILLIKIFVADENKYSDLGIPENKFSGRGHAKKNHLSRTT